MADGRIYNIIDDPTITEFETGQWYGIKCSKNLKTYADKTHTAVFIVRHGGNSDGRSLNLKETIRDGYQQIAKANAIFLYYEDTDQGVVDSHISGTKNGTEKLDKYTSDKNYARDFMTYLQDGEYLVHNPYKNSDDQDAVLLPLITGYHNLGDGTIKMACGTIDSGTYEMKDKVNLSLEYTDVSAMRNYIDSFVVLFSVAQKETTFSVTFVDYDKTVLKEAQEVKDGDNAVPPENPSRENYTFTGWEPDYTNVCSDLTCVAQYKKTETSNPITRNHCFGLNANCVITTSDGVTFSYDYESNQVYLNI